VPASLSHHKALGSREHGPIERTLAMIDAAAADQESGLDVTSMRLHRRR
jgi:hypothetical protein